MRLIVKTWKLAGLVSAMITALATAVPIIVVGVALWRIPMSQKWGALVVSAAIPIFITFPISMFAMYILKTLHEALDKLDKMVKFDSLTGLMLRAPFLDEARNCRRQSGFIALLDADHFKKINDEHGHEAGDRALRHIATVLTEVIGSNGFVARFGGEEFAIRLPRLGRSQVELLFSTLSTKLRTEGFEYKGHTLYPTLSMGVVAVDGVSPTSALLRRADGCLYQAKTEGRDKFVFETLDERHALTA
ncbi:MAG: GGDEF domain-containing protein [Aestuariivirga sp.]